MYLGYVLTSVRGITRFSQWIQM